ncbi:hypothetical protein T440DRAFT_516868 [Plenodomus tracheiphilus IPT5]|uniref:Uncharacterized protein n=1 Tax=Plenodomus tracheiphilus IPT5 TaxID=1408161 RepID=A0A6A7B9L4_9PLEO|nr:hypothetical protein T440DRAFT_516868 [Plenodomus tracheiphilus IPT5]
MYTPRPLNLLLTSLALTTIAIATPLLPTRQETPRIYARFYSGGGCQEPWREDTVFLATVPVGVCQDVTVGPFGSTIFQGNLLDRTLRFYERPCEAEEQSGRYFDVGPGSGVDPGCFAQAIGSYVVL